MLQLPANNLITIRIYIIDVERLLLWWALPLTNAEERFIRFRMMLIELQTDSGSEYKFEISLRLSIFDIIAGGGVNYLFI